MTVTIDDPDQARAALTDDRLDVPPGGVEPGAPPAGAALSWLRGAVARFTPAEAHPPRRERIERLLAPLDPAALRLGAAARTRDVLRGGPVDLRAAIARPVPVAVLAAALGANGDVADDVVTLARSYLPPAPGDADTEAALTRLIAAWPGPADEERAARISVLAQAAEATAALVVAAVRVGGVDEALRSDPPARVARRASRVDSGYAPAGTLVLIALPAPFGHGRHACPGSAVALALAGGVLDGLAGARLLDRDRLVVGAA